MASVKSIYWIPSLRQKGDKKIQKKYKKIRKKYRAIPYTKYLFSSRYKAPTMKALYIIA